jgi:CRISPR/Cas system CSM-associated protein Csm5 (group 7 of RAMP superfamily)
LIVEAANEFAAAQLAQHAKFAEAAALPRLQQCAAGLQEELRSAQQTKDTCLVCLGWGGGFLSKSSFSNTADPNVQALLKNVPAFGRALRTDVFPKTRRVVFSAGQPADFPGWVKVRFEGSPSD